MPACASKPSIVFAASSNDPSVEAQLWKMINDPDVGRTAIQGILDGPKTAARTAALQERASNPNSSLEERIVAWRALRTSDQDPAEVSAMLAQIAQSSQDPFERVRLIKAFDDAVNRPTSRDAVLLAPLDGHPTVQEVAPIPFYFVPGRSPGAPQAYVSLSSGAFNLCFPGGRSCR